MNDKLHLACPHCAAINRLPAQRLSQQPACGSCHQALFTGQPLALNEEGFDRHLQREEIPLLVDFWAPWCGPCRSMAPAFAAAAATLEPAFRLAKVDTEAVPQLPARFGIRSIPTLILFRHGREVARQAGAMGSADIVRWARSQG